MKTLTTGAAVAVLTAGTAMADDVKLGVIWLYRAD